MTKQSDFEWDSSKDKLNQEKHGVSFALAQLVFPGLQSCHFGGPGTQR